MSRAVIVINGNYDRDRASQWAKSAPSGCIIEFRQSKRSLDQNSRLWACLTEIARKVEWHGMKLPADDWKDIFTAALRKHRFVPGLDANTVVPLGMRTSDMTKQEFSDLLELINAFAAEHGVEFQDHQSSDNPSPSDEGSDGEASPSQGTVAADYSEPADAADQEEDAQASETLKSADGQSVASSSEPISPLKRMVMQECIDNMLTDAMSNPIDQAPAKIETLRRVFLSDENLGDFPDFVNRCADTALRVAGKPAERHRAKEYLTGGIPA